MSCERYQRMLHLNRPGEISDSEAEELRQHLRLCERCTLELQRIERADGFIDRFGAYAPVPGDPEKLTSSILRRVRAGSPAAPVLTPYDRFLDFFLIPSVRYSTVTIILVVTVAFMTQVLTMLDEISGLEERMTSPMRNEAVEATYTLQSETLLGVARSEGAQTLTGGSLLTVTNNRIDVRAKSVDSFLSAYGVKDLPAILGTAALHIDKNTIEKIVNEVKATAELTFRVRHEGA